MIKKISNINEIEDSDSSVGIKSRYITDKRKRMRIISYTESESEIKDNEENTVKTGSSHR